MPLTRTLILGIGNTLLRDDGIGIHVVERLKDDERLSPDTRLLDGGTLSFTLLEEIRDIDQMIVVDAARLGAAPGSIRVVENEEMDHYLRGGKRSVHEVGLADLMDMARLSDVLPTRRALVGIEPVSTDWGETPTDVVAAALEPAVEAVHALLQQWSDVP